MLLHAPLYLLLLLADGWRGISAANIYWWDAYKIMNGLG
jgi:hypothetical protein